MKNHQLMNETAENVGQTLAIIVAQVADHLSEKVSLHELSNAQLTKEWSAMRENGFQIRDCKAIKEYSEVVCFEILMNQVMECHLSHLELCNRVAKRHINEIKAIPSPATTTTQSIEHILECSILIGEGKADFSKRWASFLEQVTPRFEELMKADHLMLYRLDESILEGNATDFAKLCQELNNDLSLLMQSSELLVHNYDQYLKNWTPLTEWTSIEQSRADQRITESSHRVFEDFTRLFESERHRFRRQRELLKKNFTGFFEDLAQSAEVCEMILAKLDLYDRKWFSQQFSQSAIPVENKIAIQELAHQLRMQGEKLEDIEALAKKLTEYTAQNNVNCLAMLDDEVTNLAPTISQSVLLGVMNHLRIADPHCPLSIKHKNMITQVIKRSELVIESNSNS